jgi:hypothetical protein
MFVRALKAGFYGGRQIAVGQEFQLQAGDKAGAWMLPITAIVNPVKTPDGPKAELDRLKAEVAHERNRAEIAESDAAHSRDAVVDLEHQLEVERMRLAAVGTAALGYFDGCADEYQSATLHDVLALRQKAYAPVEPAGVPDAPIAQPAAPAVESSPVAGAVKPKAPPKPKPAAQ